VDDADYGEPQAGDDTHFRAAFHAAFHNACSRAVRRCVPSDPWDT
jgi:hypothetical protein